MALNSYKLLICTVLWNSMPGSTVWSSIAFCCFEPATCYLLILIHPLPHHLKFYRLLTGPKIFISTLKSLGYLIVYHIPGIYLCCFWTCFNSAFSFLKTRNRIWWCLPYLGYEFAAVLARGILMFSVFLQQFLLAILFIFLKAADLILL